MKMTIKPKFSKWTRWKDRPSLNNIGFPGVYALAVSEKDISGNEFDWVKEIIYFSMTNSGGGLRALLKQFDDTVVGKEGHGGERVRFEYRNYNEFANNLFVSVCPVKCNVKSNDPEDFLKMGEVAYLEYYCFAEYVKIFGQLPKFNNKKKAPKLKAKELKSANKGIQRIANKTGSR